MSRCRESVSPWVFRLYPERGSSLFVRVYVWPTKKAFLAHINEHHVSRHRGGGFSRRCEGTCSRHESRRYAKGKPTRRSPCAAEVNLWRRKLTMEVVTHELFHATMAWGYRVRFPFASLNSPDGVTAEEERITYAHGALCSQFVDRAYATGLYDGQRRQ